MTVEPATIGQPEGSYYQHVRGLGHAQCVGDASASFTVCIDIGILTGWYTGCRSAGVGGRGIPAVVFTDWIFCGTGNMYITTGFLNGTVDGDDFEQLLQSAPMVFACNGT